MGGRGMDLYYSEYGQQTSCCEHGNELLIFMKCGKFLDQLSTY